MANSMVEKLAQCLGSKAAVARACGVKTPSLYGWKRIPAKHVLVLEAAVKAKGGNIDRYSMRPDVYGQRPECTSRETAA